MVLFQNYFLQQLRSHNLADFHALLRYLLTFLFAAPHFIANCFLLRTEAVHGGVVLLLHSNGNVPILWATRSFLQEDLVVHNEPLLLLFIEQRLGVLPQTSEVSVVLTWLYSY